MLGPEEEDKPQLREDEHCHIRAEHFGWICTYLLDRREASHSISQNPCKLKFPHQQVSTLFHS